RPSAAWSVIPATAGQLDRRRKTIVCPITGLRPESDGRLGYLRSKKPRCMERLEAVSDAEDGLDILIGVATKLLAQPAHVDVEGARADGGAVAPDLHQERVARDDFPRVLHQ